MTKNKYIAGTILLIGMIATAYVKFNDVSKNPLLYKGWIDKYGVEVNTLRDSLNLPLLRDDWVTHYFDSTHIWWGKYPKGVTTTAPMHLKKVVRFDEHGLPSTEKDEFHYETNLDTISYRLICIYSFLENTSEFEFIEYYECCDSWPPNKGYPVNHSFADSIFNEWGFENYYDKNELLEKDFERSSEISAN